MAGDRGADPGPANVTPGADDHAQHASPTVLCPQGHVNAWDYRFCERCGSPIGVVPWPSEESGTRQTAPARSFVPLVVLAATLLVVAVVVTAVGYAVTRPARNDREAQFRAGRRHDRCAVRTGRGRELPGRSGA